jgi:hypothetical protein
MTRRNASCSHRRSRPSAANVRVVRRCQRHCLTATFDQPAVSLHFLTIATSAIPEASAGPPRARNRILKMLAEFPRRPGIFGGSVNPPCSVYKIQILLTGFIETRRDLSRHSPSPAGLLGMHCFLRVNPP